MAGLRGRPLPSLPQLQRSVGVTVKRIHRAYTPVAFGRAEERAVYDTQRLGERIVGVAASRRIGARNQPLASAGSPRPDALGSRVMMRAEDKVAREHSFVWNPGHDTSSVRAIATSAFRHTPTRASQRFCSTTHHNSGVLYRNCEMRRDYLEGRDATALFRDLACRGAQIIAFLAVPIPRRVQRPLSVARNIPNATAARLDFCYTLHTALCTSRLTLDLREPERLFNSLRASGAREPQIAHSCLRGFSALFTPGVIPLRPRGPTVGRAHTPSGSFSGPRSAAGSDIRIRPPMACDSIIATFGTRNLWCFELHVLVQSSFDPTDRVFVRLMLSCERVPMLHPEPTVSGAALRDLPHLAHLCHVALQLRVTAAGGYANLTPPTSLAVDLRCPTTSTDALAVPWTHSSALRDRYGLAF
ncbi:hypothetical protein B0H15DRAFT_935442 [Mycena belliarum]|uniref:Uncharacterized protein n=1 Tax=Mycena belliarum TaxID=1033014 RepID=A0AAD6TNG5_9AGAR|nr:hypothetical protein B0H15DRAFT_935442 [Mycena belliae]